MLVLSRKLQEIVRIGDSVVVQVLGTDGNSVRLGITAPPNVKVLRKELLDRQKKTAARRILIVDDCPEDREAFRRLMADRPVVRYVIKESDSGEEGLAVCRAEPPDCVLLDYRLPDLDGIEFLDRLRRQQDRLLIPVIMVTGQVTGALADEARRSGAQGFLAKTDLSRDLLQQAVQAAIRDPHAPRIALPSRRN
ncbi:MAG: response regulator [Planctomycetes bacterium]|nr:response regulator [Planctomycetota bacterium]